MADNHYVDNKKLFQAMKEYREAVQSSKANNTKRPEIPRYVGECILLIGKRLAMKPNFANYSYKEEMISDGIENCICYIDNFDPAKSDNPFAYFTQIIYFAFLRRIAKEKKQMYIKHKTFENSMLFDQLVEQSEWDDVTYHPHNDFDNDNVSEFIKNFEANAAKKKEKGKTGVEAFIEEELGEIEKEDLDEDSANN